MLINEGFTRKRKIDNRLPPGQYETKDFPVLSLGPTPLINKKNWTFEVKGLVENPMSWTWEEFLKLPMTKITKDIHCVTRWSKFDTNWKGVSVDYLMEIANVKSKAKFVIAHSYDGYSTNLPIEDISDGKAIVALEYDGKEIPAEHGGPARTIVPHLYFWKSAKWVKSLEFVEKNSPGFWEVRGYHNYGDPWKEERFS